METERPTLRSFLPAIITGAIFVLITVLVSIWAWGQLPADAQLPTHWGPNGQPDRYGNKIQGLFMMPLVIAIMTLLFTVIAYVEPRRKHISKSLPVYNIILIAITGFFAGLHIVMILNYLGSSISIARIVPLGIGILFIIIGNFMGKVRSNFMLGIKTPWTLSSETAWNKTHRLGGWAFLLTGLAIILSSIFCSGTVTMIVLLVGVALILLISFGYSYWAWSRSSDRRES